MQDRVGGRNVKFTDVEKTLSAMGRLEKLVLRIGYCVSLRGYDIVVTNYMVQVSAIVLGLGSRLRLGLECTLLSLLCNHCMQ